MDDEHKANSHISNKTDRKKNAGREVQFSQYGASKDNCQELAWRKHKVFKKLKKKCKNLTVQRRQG